jgi:stringent starvation protein B
MNIGEQKKRVVEELLAKGDVMICLDSRLPEVRVAEIHQGKPDLRLILNLGFRGSIRVFEEGIQADLRFQGKLVPCWIPFESLWAVYNPQTGEGVLWPDGLPQEVASLLGETRIQTLSDHQVSAPEQVRRSSEQLPDQSQAQADPQGTRGEGGSGAAPDGPEGTRDGKNDLEIGDFAGRAKGSGTAPGRRVAGPQRARPARKRGEPAQKPFLRVIRGAKKD